MNQVTTTSGEYDKYLPRWKKCRDFCAGQDDVMAGGEAYLPKIAGQTADEYKEYLRSGYLYNASGRTRQGLVGMVMRKEPDINVPARMKAVIDDIDQEGTTIEEMAGKMVEEELTVARGGLLVDFPNIDTGGMSQAEAEQMNLRPYVVQYKAEDIIAVRTKRVQNATKVVHVRLKETDEQQGGSEFETDTVQRVRVLELVEEGNNAYYRQRLFKQEKENGELIEDPSEAFEPRINGQRLSEIPFVFVGGHKFREPHIIDLVNANKHHYQLTAGHRRGLRWTTRPQITASGQKEDEVKNLVVGGDAIWWTSNSEATWEMLEYTGTGLSGVEKALDATKSEMATLGARMIAPEQRMAETAEAHMIKRQGENSALGTVANHVSSALTKALEWCALWMGVTEAVSVNLNTDFIPAEMTAEEVLKWTQVLQSGQILPEDYYHALSQGEVLDPAITIEDRIQRIQTRAPMPMNP